MENAEDTVATGADEKPKTGKGAGRGAHNRGRLWGNQSPGGPKPVESSGGTAGSGSAGGGGDPGVSGLVGDQLADMRHVYTKGQQQDKTQGQKTCRRWMKDDPKGFMGMLTKLEAEKREREKPKEEAAERDDGVERARGMIEALLKEWEGR